MTADGLGIRGLVLRPRISWPEDHTSQAFPANAGAVEPALAPAEAKKKITEHAAVRSRTEHILGKQPSDCREQHSGVM